MNSTDAKTFYPHGLRPWDGEWEEPAGITPASLAWSQPGKSSRAPPRTPLGPQGPRPLQLAHRIPDTTQPGQLPFIFYFQGGLGAKPPCFPASWAVAKDFTSIGCTYAMRQSRQPSQFTADALPGTPIRLAQSRRVDRQGWFRSYGLSRSNGGSSLRPLAASLVRFVNLSTLCYSGVTPCLHQPI